MQQITAQELKRWLDDPGRQAPILLDVREPWEFDRCRIEGSDLVPMRRVPGEYGRFDPQRDTVVICHHGVRSYQVARFLEHYGFSRVYNLHGGVDAWAREVDSRMPVY